VEKIFSRPVKGRADSGLPKLLSLFCGAGGLDIGFSQAGFRTFLSVDNMASAIETQKKNKLSRFSLCEDISEFGSARILGFHKENNFKGGSIGVIGGPPCQGFSRANSSRGLNDPRNELVKRYVDVIERLNKKIDIEFVVFENVAGIKDEANSGVYKYLLEKLNKLGFNVTELDLMATNFGVPQMRRRILVVAEKYGCDFSPVSSLVASNEPNVDAFIKGLPEPLFYSRKGVSADDIPYHPNHWTMSPKSYRFTTSPEKWRKSRSFKLLKWGGPSPTIAFGNREIHVHPSAKRRLSIFEAMRLQGFPDNFQIMGNLSEQVTQISNAVPPPIGYEIARVLRKERAKKKVKKNG
jgi:DNA (cytosine-5)-methyltransferase 1